MQEDFDFRLLDDLDRYPDFGHPLFHAYRKFLPTDRAGPFWLWRKYIYHLSDHNQPKSYRRLQSSAGLNRWRLDFQSSAGLTGATAWPRKPDHNLPWPTGPKLSGTNQARCFAL